MSQSLTFLPSRHAIASISLALVCACAQPGPEVTFETIESVQHVGSITVTIDSPRAVYQVGDSIRPIAILHDENGVGLAEDTSQGLVDFQVHPAEAAEDRGHGRFRLLAEGTIVVEGCAMDASNAPLCDEIELIVDGSAPGLTVTSPTPGAMIAGNPGEPIIVEGHVESSHGLREVFVNGEAAEVQDDGHFSINIPSRFGVNHVEVVASDGLQRHSTVQEFDVLFAHGYIPLEDGSLTVPDALSLRISQSFFDVRPDAFNPTGEAPPMAVDELLTMALDGLSISSLIDNPVVDEDGLSLDIHAAALRDPDIAIDLLDDGIEVTVTLPKGLLLGTEGQLTIFDLSYDLTSLIVVRPTITLRLGIVPLNFGNVTLHGFYVANTDVSFNEINALFAEDTVAAVFDVADSLLRRRFEEELSQALLAPVASEMSSAFNGLLSSMGLALAENEFAFGFGIGPDVAMSMHAHLGALKTDFRNSMSASLSARLSGPVPSEDQPHLLASMGAPMLHPEPQASFRDDALAVGIRIDALNAMLHTLWQGGSLEGPVVAPVPNVSISSKLPPVLRPPREGEEGDLVLSLGQLEISMGGETPEETVTLGAGLEASLTVEVSEGFLRLTIAEVPGVQTWQVSEATSLLFTAEVLATIVQSMWSDISEGLGENLTFEIPSPNLEALAPVSEEIAAATLVLSQTRPVEVHHGYLTIDLPIQVSVPALQ